MSPLFRNNHTQFFSAALEPACGYCEHGTPTQDGGAILCARSGVVTPSYSCKKFRYDPISRAVRPRILTGDYTAADFEL